MNRNKQIVLSVAALCLLIGAAWAFYLYSKPHASAADKKTDVVIGADSLYASFSNDEAGANKKYINKVAEVTGIVQDISISDRKPVVFLRTSGPGVINCLMAMDSVTVFATIKKIPKP